MEDIKKKRGRKKKSEMMASLHNEAVQNIQVAIDDETTGENTIPLNAEPILRKRGRKPKGGKLILKQAENSNKQMSIANVILHLKCSMNDLNDYNTNINKMVTDPLEYNPSIPPEILTYNQNDNSQFSIYELNKINNISVDTNNDYAYNDTTNNTGQSKPIVCSICKSKQDNTMAMENNEPCQDTPEECVTSDTDIIEDEDINLKDLNYKLKKIKINLYKNMIQDKKSACFWCTYHYDNPSCYIPKYEMDDTIYGYGSFCRPECAVAYLMKENIDDSTKFERYHLLNQIYSKIYDFKKNIKPAPNPYYLLDKYYGNLTIQEYRKLLKTEHMLLVIDKPLTRILPELHEDNDDMMTYIYGTGNRILNNVNNNNNHNGVYKVKKQIEKQQGPSKSSIIRDKFGIS